MHGELNVHVAM